MNDTKIPQEVINDFISLLSSYGCSFVDFAEQLGYEAKPIKTDQEEPVNDESLPAEGTEEPKTEIIKKK